MSVAAYAVKLQNTIHAGKLHKFLYYAQKRSIEMTGLPLFNDSVEAWVYGASIPAVYELHRGKEFVTWSVFPEEGIELLCLQHQQIVIDTLKTYGNLDTAALSLLNQAEYAYKQARGNLPSYTKGTHRNEITVQVIKEGLALNQ